MASKKELALELYKKIVAEGVAEKDRRKTFIARAQLAPLSMTPAGASTYFVNSKNEANGVAAPSYYKPASEKRVSQAVDDSKENQPLWSLVFCEDLKKGAKCIGTADQVHCYTSEEAAVARFKKLNPGNRERCVVAVGEVQEGAIVADLQVIAQ